MSSLHPECHWIGELPAFKQPSMCDHCHKLRSAGDVIRCRMRGPRIEGIGDVIAAATRATGIDRVVKAIAGEDCGCPHRQAALNKLVPFESRESESPLL